jgi:hypothetical protein
MIMMLTAKCVKELLIDRLRFGISTVLLAKDMKTVLGVDTQEFNLLVKENILVSRKYSDKRNWYKFNPESLGACEVNKVSIVAAIKDSCDIYNIDFVPTKDCKQYEVVVDGKNIGVTIAATHEAIQQLLEEQDMYEVKKAVK